MGGGVWDQTVGSTWERLVSEHVRGDLERTGW